MKTKQRKFFWASVTAIALIFIAFPAMASEKRASEGKVAIVNGSLITQGDFNREVSVVQQRLLSKGRTLNESQLLEMKKNVLESLINRELLYQESQKQGIKVNDAAAEDRLRKVKERFPNEGKFKNALSAMNLSEDVLRSQFKRDLTIRQFIDKKFVQGLIVSDKETRAYYDDHQNLFKQPEQVRARHILIKVAPQADESQKAEARKNIEQIQKKLQRGEDFAALAKAFSEDPSNAKGGDLGYFKRGQMVKHFEDVALALRPGEVSDIVETRFGYHIIELIDKKPESLIAYEEIKDKLQQYLKQQKFRNQLTQYIEELRGKAKIQRFLTKEP